MKPDLRLRFWAAANQYQTQAAFLRRLGPTVDELEIARNQAARAPDTSARAQPKQGGTPVALSSATRTGTACSAGRVRPMSKAVAGRRQCNGCWPPDILRPDATVQVRTAIPGWVCRSGRTISSPTPPASAKSPSTAARKPAQCRAGGQIGQRGRASRDISSTSGAHTSRWDAR